MDSLPPCPPLLDILVDRINIGIFGVNRNMEITLWNRFMESHSGKSAAEVMGKNLFECFDELHHNILQHKINSVFILKNFAGGGGGRRPGRGGGRRGRPGAGGGGGGGRGGAVI